MDNTTEFISFISGEYSFDYWGDVAIDEALRDFIARRKSSMEDAWF